MTPAQKAVETRQKNKEKRDQKAQREKRITEAMVTGLLSVLEDESSSVDQKLEASKILNEVRKGVR